MAGEGERLIDQLFARLPMVRVVEISPDERAARVQNRRMARQRPQANVDTNQVAVFVEIQRDRIDFFANPVAQCQQQQVDPAITRQQRCTAATELLPISGFDDAYPTGFDALQHNRLH